MPTVAEIIHHHQDDIMRLWLDDARAAASARGLSEVALENVMAMFLAALADQVESGQVDANDRRRKYVNSHLSSRLRQGFDLAEIVNEFALLGQCVAKRWQALPENQWPSASDVERLYTQIHVAITDVTDAFRRHMLEDEQSEKRYLRRLQEIASAALHDPEKPLRERLAELLDVVMEAMGAQCAAFLLYDTSKAKLVLTACVGSAALEPYATSIDPRSFVGAVAMREDPTSIYDARSTRLDVPGEVRRSGIHSLLGVRLPPRNSLLGVMYIGLAETREFTTREIGRIESLGERVGLHIENARLFAELHDKIEALDVEKALRERFVSTLAHDLRGPLSAARLAAELLAGEPASLDERRDLGIRIDRNIGRVDRMIRDLLDANRIRAGELLPLRLDACDLGALAARVVEEARVMHGDRFQLEVEEPVRGIWSEEDLHRALWNLVTNAVKYGASKEPITIAVGRHDDGARVSVHNLGSPIPATEQTHIFDAYARAPTADAAGRTGWGLGLTLVRGAAEAHGGHVSLTSDAESGTTFIIDLPFDARSARSSHDERPPATDNSAGARGTPIAVEPFKERLHALVADDDTEMSSMVSKALREFGADVVAVASGGELLESIANAGPFDIIVTDIAMPWMTGLQVMHSARTAGLPVPVVVMTALRDPTLPEQVTALGAHAELLQKPFSTEELYDALRRCLAEIPPSTYSVSDSRMP